MVNSPPDPSAPSGSPAYPDSLTFVPSEQYERALAEYEPDPSLRAEYTEAVKWAVGIDPWGQTAATFSDKTRVFVSEVAEGWPTLWIWLHFESDDLIRICDVTEP